MNKYAHIENGVVVNTSRSTPEVAAERGLVELPTGFGKGDLYDGVSFSKPPFDNVAQHALLVREATRLLRDSAWVQDEDIAPQDRVTWGQWRSDLRAVRNLLPEEVTEDTTIPNKPENVEFELPEKAANNRSRRR